ncbi:unnamed protein product, partial [Prorocentrum cordatum]
APLQLKLGSSRLLSFAPVASAPSPGAKLGAAAKEELDVVGEAVKEVPAGILECQAFCRPGGGASASPRRREAPRGRRLRLLLRAWPRHLRAQ